jgi:hypothetical protein
MLNWMGRTGIAIRAVACAGAMPGKDKEVAEAPEVTKDLRVNETSTGFVDAVEQCLRLASDLQVEYASARMQKQCTGLKHQMEHQTRQPSCLSFVALDSCCKLLPTTLHMGCHSKVTLA